MSGSASPGDYFRNPGKHRNQVAGGLNSMSQRIKTKCRDGVVAPLLHSEAITVFPGDIDLGDGQLVCRTGSVVGLHRGCARIGPPDSPARKGNFRGFVAVSPVSVSS